MRNERKEAVKELLRCEASRRILWQFCMYYDHEFFSKRPFLKDIADGFQAIEDKRE